MRMLDFTSVPSERSFDLPPPPVRAGAEITWKHLNLIEHRRERFGALGAQLFVCESNEINEVEIFAYSHSLLMRCEGAASRCEIEWPDEGGRKLPEFRRGSILFTPACGVTRVRKRDHGRFCSLGIEIPPAALEQLDDDGALARVSLTPQAGPGDPELCRVVGAMYDEMNAPGPVGPLYQETLALQLLVLLVRHAATLTLVPTKGGLAGWQLRRAIELLEADLARAPSLHQLADEVGLSPSHFCTAFRQSTGLPPHKYLLHSRVAQAKQLMADRRRNLTEIALKSGFASSSQFATTFRRIEGITPTAYRRGL
jgi:AraC family transcriptional regulator